MFCNIFIPGHRGGHNGPHATGTRPKKSSLVDFRENRVFRPVFDAESEYELIFGRFGMVRVLSCGSGGVWNRPGTAPKKWSLLNFRENRISRPVFDAESDYELISGRFVIIRDLSGGSVGFGTGPEPDPKI